MRLSEFHEDHAGAVVALWQKCGLTRPWNDPYRDIARKQTDKNGRFLVGYVWLDISVRLFLGVYFWLSISDCYLTLVASGCVFLPACFCLHASGCVYPVLHLSTSGL